MAKKWDVEVRDLYARGEIKSFRAILAAIEKTPFSKAIGTSPRRFRDLIANPELFKLGDIYQIAVFLKGKDKVTPTDERAIVNLIHDYCVSMRSSPKKSRKKSGSR